MRRFIYLDTDTLNSYLAQIFDGLIQTQETEKSTGKKSEKQNRFVSSLGGQIAFKLFGKGIDANAQATYPLQHSNMVIRLKLLAMLPIRLWRKATHMFRHSRELGIQLMPL